MRAETADKRQGHNSWMTSLSDSRQNCRKAVSRSELRAPDPTQAVWPQVDPRSASRPHKSVAMLHASVLDYVEHVSPYSDSCFKLWSEQLDTHTLPDGEELDVSLASIDDWKSQLYEVENRTVHELTGVQTETEVKRVYIPPKYGRMLFEQLDRCIEQLGLAAHLEAGRDRDDAGW